MVLDQQSPNPMASRTPDDLSQPLTEKSKPRRLPPLTKFMAILGLIFAAIRISAVIGITWTNPPNQIFDPGTWELGINMALIVLGISANLQLLRQSRLGIFQGWCLVGCIVLSCFAGAWVTWNAFQQATAAGFRPSGWDTLLQFSIVLAARLGLTFLYVKSLLAANREFPRHTDKTVLPLSATR